MKKYCTPSSDKIACLALVIILLGISLSGITLAFDGFSNATNGEWYNSSWHYRIRIEVNSSGVNRTDWPIETEINFTSLLPSGTFDSNSIRVIEYNESGKIKYEIPSQFDRYSAYDNTTNAIGELVFIMNGTTPANAKRIFYIYYDTIENGAKQMPVYTTSLAYSWDGKTAIVNTTKLEIRIDTNRAQNTSGIYYVEDKGTQVPVITVDANNMTAEYLEYFNGTANTTFDLRNNATFVYGPVRITISQEGPEIAFGNTSSPTYSGRIIKKYYIYNRAGPQSYGSFIKISQEFIANTSANRSSPNSGAPAFDIQRSFLSTDIASTDNSTSDPYSWAWATDTGGSTFGIVNINETVDGFFASKEISIGRLGVSFLNTQISQGSTIRQVSLVYFGRGGSDGVLEFLNIMNGTSIEIQKSRNLTEKWSVVITPSVNQTIFNKNETLLIKGNVTYGDMYNLTKYINATLDMGTPSTSDDVTLTLYDDGTNGDQVAGDRLFTRNFTFALDAATGQWNINMSAYGNATEHLNSTIFKFNVTDVYFVNVSILNPNGLINRQVFANITVKNFAQTSLIPGAQISCAANGVDVVNKTDNGDGTHSINFTAPSSVGFYTLFCNATRANNTGNDTKQYTAEAAKTSLVVNATPQNTSLGSISLYNNQSFKLDINATNGPNGTAGNVNITLELLSGWVANATQQGCGDIGINSSCVRSFNVTVPNATSPGIYVINATAAWINPDTTQNMTRIQISVFVLENPQLDIYESNVSGVGADGITKNITTFTLIASGNNMTNSINFSCASGYVCQNFNVSFSPQSLANLSAGFSAQISVLTAIPLNHTYGVFNGTINASSGALSDTLTMFVTIQPDTKARITTDPVSVVISNMSIYSGASFPLLTNMTNIGNSSARSSNITFFIPLGWFINSSIEYCGNLTTAATCTRYNQVSVPNSTSAGNYTINITGRWINLDNTQGDINYTLNVTITINPVVDVENASLTGVANSGSQQNAFNMTVLSVGSANITNVTFLCVSGQICQNFTLAFSPGSIASLGVGNKANVTINVTVPPNFPSGLYTGTLNITAGNDGTKHVSLTLDVLANRTWTLVPTFCQKSTFTDEGKVCDVNVTNTGNAPINFTIIPIVANKTAPNVTNFTVQMGTNYTFSILYNITGFQQFVYNSTFLISSLDPSAPQNVTLNITLLPSTPPNITLEIMPDPANQLDEITIKANVTDNTQSGIIRVNVTVTMPNGTKHSSNMTFIGQSGNLTVWGIVYANSTISTFGNTTLRGVYNVSVTAEDNIGNIATVLSNFTVQVKLNIASTTLSAQYFQGDTATIYYSVRNISGLGVENVNASFAVRDKNSTLIYSTSRMTDLYGTFEPLPVFALASDATVGNYTLASVSTYNDTIANKIVVVQRNYSFVVNQKTVTVNGLFADIETAVVWFPNNVMRFSILLYDGEGLPVDPTSLNLTVYDPAQNIYFSAGSGSMTKKGTGFYSYSFAMPATTATGMYLAVLNASRNSLNTMKLKAFRVAQGGPYDVRLQMMKSEVEQGTPLDFNIIIENKGEVTQDVFVNYTITNVASGQVYYTSSEAVLTPAFSNQSFTRSAFVFSDQPLGTYRLMVTVKYDNTQPDINVSTTFAVIAPKKVQQQGSVGGGGGAPPITGEAPLGTTPDVVSSIIIEKYNDNVTMYPGFRRIEYVIVKNTGRTTLSDVTLNIIGISTSWFNITPSVYKSLGPQNSSVFLVEYTIPNDAPVGEYKANIIATTTTTSDQRMFVVSIMRSIYDVVLAELEKIKRDLRNLLIDIGTARAEGKNIGDVITFADKAEEHIKNAEINLNLNNTQTAFSNVKDAKVMIDKAKDLLNSLEKIKPEARIDYVFIAFVLAMFGGTGGAIYLMKKKGKMPKQAQHLAHLISIIEKMKKPRDDTTLMKEREKIRRMLTVLENEKREGIISDSAYSEMKKSIESKLSKIEKNISKRR